MSNTNEKDLCSTFRISENLQEQEDEITALTEIISDDLTFKTIDFNRSDYLDNIHTPDRSVSEAEISSTSKFFKSMLETNNGDVESIDIYSKNYRYGGTMRISPDLQHILNNNASSIESICIKCKRHLKDNSEPSDGYPESLDSELSNNNHQDNYFSIKVNHLPPIVLNFVLPHSYPSDNPPNISLFCSWLNKEQLSQLKENMISLWKDSGGSVILFTWQSYLQDDSMNFLDPLEIPPKSDFSETYCGPVLDISKAVQEKLLQLKELTNSKEELKSIDQTLDSSHASGNSIENHFYSSNEILKSTHHNQADEKLPKNKSETSSCIKSSSENKETLKSHNSLDRQKYYGIVEKYFDQKGYGFIRIFDDGLKRVNLDNVQPIKTNVDDKSKNKTKKHQRGYKYWWDVYFHLSGLQNSKSLIKKGIEVEFELVDDHRRNNSREVKTNPQDNSFKNDQNKRYKAINIESLPQKFTVRNEGSKGSTATNNSLENTMPPTSKVAESNSKCDKKQSEINCVMNILKYFKDYNELEDEKRFDANVYLCLVCFNEKLGSKCMKFPNCNHVYCSDCMKAYFQVQIAEGMMSNLVCPNDGCDSKALPTQIRKLVSKNQYELYEKQLLSTTLDTMADVALCPRVQCQCPTIIDREKNMGQCPKCEYAFCIYCRSGYHGLDPCRIDSKEKRQLIQEYMSADANRKRDLEKRYGRIQLQRMVDTLLDDQYLKENASKCPNCNTFIQKTEGCNKMTCLKCNTYFCYLCGGRLPRENPYGHYSERNSQCFNQLFEGANDPFMENDLHEIEGNDSDDDFLVIEDANGLLRLL